MGRQQYGAAEGAKVANEAGENIRKRDGGHRNPVAKQVAIMDGKACHICGAPIEGLRGDGVGVKTIISTDGRHLDDVTHFSV